MEIETLVKRDETTNEHHQDGHSTYVYTAHCAFFFCVSLDTTHSRSVEDIVRTETSLFVDSRNNRSSFAFFCIIDCLEQACCLCTKKEEVCNDAGKTSRRRRMLIQIRSQLHFEEHET
ncbi:hypothetical protein L3Y34_013670 [Caenorhabditis briggsae]|uniref:GON domain-containing protein n=1 Tax=Caenorhabditis briggsae TaxID=6238 RepID=A0AAE9CXA9_CAEBR|nr:hypothetical protein L3Y34_013670 [Caenorhabditis briggsae]